MDATATPSLSRNGEPAVQVYRVTLDELNTSGVHATATLLVKGGELVVTLNGVGLVPGRVHPQHVHGFTAQASACPTAANDADGDGILTIGEGSAAFGPVQVDLQSYPSPANVGGAISYQRAFELSAVPFAPSELPQKTMVLHGAFVEDTYVGSLPVACGEIERVN